MKSLGKKSFLNNLELLFSAREKVLTSFKSRLFSITNLDKIPTREPTEPTTEPEVATEPTPKPATEPTPTKHKKSKLKFQHKFMNEIIADEKDKNNEIFSNYFKYRNPWFLVKDLISAKQNKNKKLVNNINNGSIDLRNNINRKEVPENGNPEKIDNIVEKILDFNKQQKGKGIKILTPEQMLKRLPIALAQVKAGNTSENLLNETRQVMYSFY